jgi:uncharacterized protein YegL
MKQYTDITIFLDRSGSMDLIRKDMEGAFNTFVKKHQEVPSTKLTLIQFDSQNDQDVVYSNVPVKAVEPLSLHPRGGTPLLDALCKAIDNTGQRLASIQESDRPDQVLMVIITDGQDNSSRLYRREDVKNRVNKQHGDYKWQFIYLGANQDAFAEAASYGISPQWTLNYAANSAGTAGAFAGLMSNTVNYTSSAGGMRGQSVRSFTKEQRDEAVENKTVTTSK